MRRVVHIFRSTCAWPSRFASVAVLLVTSAACSAQSVPLDPALARSILASRFQHDVASVTLLVGESIAHDASLESPNDYRFFAQDGLVSPTRFGPERGGGIGYVLTQAGRGAAEREGWQRRQADLPGGEFVIIPIGVCRLERVGDVQVIDADRVAIDFSVRIVPNDLGQGLMESADAARWAVTDRLRQCRQSAAHLGELTHETIGAIHGADGWKITRHADQLLPVSDP